MPLRKLSEEGYLRSELLSKEYATTLDVHLMRVPMLLRRTQLNFGLLSVGTRLRSAPGRVISTRRAGDERGEVCVVVRR
jgi:hypothetical protein